LEKRISRPTDIGRAKGHAKKLITEVQKLGARIKAEGVDGKKARGSTGAV